jgi:subtilisin
MRRVRVGVLGALVVALSVGMPAYAAKPPEGSTSPAPTVAPASPYPVQIVVFRDGVPPLFKALIYRVRPTFVYRYAFPGFAAPLSPQQVARISADRDVLMVTPVDHSARLPQSSAAHTATPPTPIEGFPQQVPRGVRRVGTLLSPTARIDGHDDPMNVNIAIVDTGIDPAQPDLNVRGGVACAAGSGYADSEGHGTLVAGVAAARDNAFGVVGVAPGARLWAVRVFAPGADQNTDAELLCGIDWVTQHARTIDVANLSLGDTGSDDGHCGLVNKDPVHWAICHSVAGGVTYVASTGNDFIDTTGIVPAAYSEVIAVSGMTDTDGLPGALGPPDNCYGEADDTFAFFSNYGAPVDISAPAMCVGSTFPNGELAFDSGTSFAAPHVTGAVALIKVRHPWASPAQVKAMILAAREQVHLPGDPDGIDEGVLNVSTF